MGIDLLLLFSTLNLITKVGLLERRIMQNIIEYINVKWEPRKTRGHLIKTHLVIGIPWVY